MRYIGPKVKLSRSLGIALTPKAQKYMDKRPYPPGQHGPSTRSRIPKSVFGKQLLEKQRLRFQYNISEKQMRNYYLKAARKRGNTADILAQMLELRLDAVVYRGGLAKTIYAAQQYVNHGHIEVNGKRVDIRSFQVKVGDVVRVREKSQALPCFQESAVYTPPPPDYLTRNRDEMTVSPVRLPRRDEVPVICDFGAVIEYYSR